MTVTRLEREIPYRELVEWMQEYARDPWGTWRDNAHSALVAATVANAFRGEKSKPFTFEDFMFMDKETSEKRRKEKQVEYNRNLIAALKAMAK
jgi:hypothetical protein